MPIFEDGNERQVYQEEALNKYPKWIIGFLTKKELKKGKKGYILFTAKTEEEANSYLAEVREQNIELLKGSEFLEKPKTKPNNSGEASNAWDVPWCPDDVLKYLIPGGEYTRLVPASMGGRAFQTAIDEMDNYTHGIIVAIKEAFRPKLLPEYKEICDTFNSVCKRYDDVVVHFSTTGLEGFGQPLYILLESVSRKRIFSITYYDASPDNDTKVFKSCVYSSMEREYIEKFGGFPYSLYATRLFCLFPENKQMQEDLVFKVIQFMRWRIGLEPTT